MDTDARKEEILAAAAHLFAVKGYRGTSMSDISRAVGLGRGGLYHHIRSKEELLTTIHDRSVDPLLFCLAELDQSDLSPGQKLTQISCRMLRIIADNRDWQAILAQETPIFSSRQLHQLKAKRLAVEQGIHQIVLDGIAQGCFMALDARAFVLAFLGMHNWAYTWLKRDGRLTPEQVGMLFTGFLLNGISQGMG